MRTRLLLALYALAIAAGCVTPVLMSPASTPLDGRTYSVTGKTSGQSCLMSILGIPIATDASLETALKDAREKANAEALIDVVVERSTLITLLFNRVCTEVHATGIRFSVAAAPYLPPVPAVTALPDAEVAPVVTPPAVEPSPAPQPITTRTPAIPATVKPPAKPSAAELRKAEAERKRLAAEEKKRLAEEEKKRRAEEERRRLEEERQKAEEAKAKVEQAKRKAEEEKKALAAKAAAEAAKPKPVPDQYKDFCKYSPADTIRVETKTEVLEVQFQGCASFGIQVAKQGEPAGVIPFEQIWMVKLVRGKPLAEPAAPIVPEPEPQTDQPKTPAVPRSPAIPQ